MKDRYIVMRESGGQKSYRTKGSERFTTTLYKSKIFDKGSVKSQARDEVRLAKRKGLSDDTKIFIIPVEVNVRFEDAVLID